MTKGEREKLLKLAAQMVLCTGMPSAEYGDWKWSKSMTKKAWRKVWLSAAMAETTCKQWAKEIRDITDKPKKHDDEINKIVALLTEGMLTDEKLKEASAKLEAFKMERLFGKTLETKELH